MATYFPNEEAFGKLENNNLYYNYVALNSPKVQYAINKIQEELKKPDGNPSSYVSLIPKGLLTDIIGSLPTTTLPNGGVVSNTNFNYYGGVSRMGDKALLDKNNLNILFGGSENTQQGFNNGGSTTFSDSYVNKYARGAADNIFKIDQQQNENRKEGEYTTLEKLSGALESFSNDKDSGISTLTDVLGVNTKERPIDDLFNRDRNNNIVDTRTGVAQVIPQISVLNENKSEQFAPKVTGNYTPIAGGTLGGGAINYALKPNAVGETKAGGGTLSVLPSTSGDVYYVKSSQNGPQISVADKDQYERTLETAKNITPIVNYNTAQSAITNASVINQDLANQAKQVQEILTNSLIKGIYAGVGSQTDRPEYTIDNQIGSNMGVFQNDIAPISPLTPITQENINKKINEQLTLDENRESKIDAVQKEKDALAFEEQKKKSADELDAIKKQSQNILDQQAKTNAELEAKKIADAKFAEGERLRLSNKFDYDSEIEKALRASEKNIPIARKQLQDIDANQKIADAEMLAQTKSTGGNPLGYAGGFAEKAIEKSAPTPQAMKVPSFARPPAPPITPVANSLTPSSLLPNLEGLQFGGN